MQSLHLAQEQNPEFERQRLLRYGKHNQSPLSLARGNKQSTRDYIGCFSSVGYIKIEPKAVPGGELESAPCLEKEMQSLGSTGSQGTWHLSLFLFDD